MQLGLEGKTALVTGSWRGTGTGIAKSLALEGARVLIHGLEDGQAEPQANALIEEGLRAEAVTGDIQNDLGHQALIEDLARRSLDVDILVNNYGVAESGTWSDTGTDEWVNIYQKNVLSGVRLVQSLSPSMETRGWGRIIFIGTIGSLRPAARMPHYYASKATLPNLCISLAKSLAETGVTVNLVSPGIIGTAEVREMLLKQAERAGHGRDWQIAQRHGLKKLFGSPAGRVAEMSEVGDLVAFVASERAAYINGANLRIDGGAADCAL
ncbi:MAG: SDR family oxidoreductase [Myxococcota bacterium]|nr:SDR family oxidoreductase [Myxococcota bacterium]